MFKKFLNNEKMESICLLAAIFHSLKSSTAVTSQMYQQQEDYSDWGFCALKSEHIAEKG